MKTVLITGCSSGFGLDIAKYFLAQDWHVIATMRTPNPDILPTSDRLRILPLDVTDAASIAAAVAEAGPIDVLVNNAGIGWLNALEGSPLAVVRDVFETNTFGTMAMIQAVLPQFRGRQAGMIINVTSSVTILPLPLLSVYTASKAAVNAFTESLALELAPFNIAVRLVLPGAAPGTSFGKTAMGLIQGQGGFPDAYAEFTQGVIGHMQSQTGPLTQSSDVAEAVWRAATDPGTPMRLPAGADAVIMQEDAVVAGEHVSFTSQPQPGRSVRAKGNDFATGQQLVQAGVRLTPMQLAVAAAANSPALMVSRRPAIALLATGDELELPGTPLGPDQIIASNSFGLAPLLSPYAETLTDHGIARDNRAQLRAKLQEIFAGEPDILITTGGASVGDHDIVQEILVELGVTLDFWRINMRPGKPLMFGTRGRTLVFGLPGNPVSAMVTAIVFIKPALRHWVGLAPQPDWQLPLAGPTPANTARRHFMRARLLHTPQGPQAEPISQTDSGHTSSMAHADLLIVQPEHDPGQSTGTIVEAIVVDAF